MVVGVRRRLERRLAGGKVGEVEAKSSASQPADHLRELGK